ncbi:MAG: hypothetical protein AB7P00_07050 [Sandaracinaceae bacterium]
MTRRTIARGASVAACVLLVSALAPVARGAIPPRHGGVLTLPAPVPVLELDPTHVKSALEAGLVEAVFDGLYEIDPDGRPRPVLAAGPAEREGNVARIVLREGVRHHGGARPLSARQVVRSLMRAAASPETGWLFGALELENGHPMIRETGERTLELTLARPRGRIETLLAATSLRIVVGGNLRRRPLGTGAFRAQLDGRGGADLTIFRFAVDSAPWMNRIRFLPPRARDDELRAFELGELDGSWQGRSLYGREPTRALSTTEVGAVTPWLMVPNRARALRDDGEWVAVARAIDRRRLERVGIAPRASLLEGLPEPHLPSASPRAGGQLVMPVHADRPVEVRLAEAVAGMLDERGIHLAVERLSEARYDALIARGQWDLRLSAVRPPLPGRSAMVAAALAAAGQLDRARALAGVLGESDQASDEARTMSCVVLGYERIVLHYDANVVGLELDLRGRLSLADASLRRTVEPFR